MRFFRPKFLVVPLLLLILLALGCGGGDGDTGSTAAKRQTQTAFAMQADRICQEQTTQRLAAISAEVAEQERKGKSTITDQFYEVLLDRALPAMERMVDRLRRLDAPSSGGDKASDLIKSFERAVKEVTDNPRRVLNGFDVFAAARKQAAALGLKNCAQIY